MGVKKEVLSSCKVKLTFLAIQREGFRSYLGGKNTESLLENPRKIGDFGESAICRRLGNARAVKHQGSCVLTSQKVDLAYKRGVGYFLEGVAEITFAEMKSLGYSLNRELFLIMLLNIEKSASHHNYFLLFGWVSLLAYA